jgi:metal-dependent amidase/aminoacylase/carboxypeptidase family protein
MIRVAKRLYGETITGTFGLPAKGTEDFSLYLKQVPGALIFIGGADEDHHTHLHSPNYNFNDKLIPYVADYWMALLEDRFAQ